MLCSKVDLVSARKEAAVHQMMDHPNIIHYLCSKIFAESIVILMELAAGGELFDRIG